MGKIDILDREFFAEPERFAELINTEFYQGREILLPNKLEHLIRCYPSLSSMAGEKNRDILMRDNDQNICYGLEIETESDYSMPERIMTYDACEYEYQIREIHKEHRAKKEYKKYRDKKSRMKKEDFLLPTVTMVLYLGEGHWQGRICLRQMFRMTNRLPELYEKRIRDYHFPLIEAESVKPEKYHTDLCEFFRAMQCRGNRDKLKALSQTEQFKGLNHETEVVISAHLNNKNLLRKVEEEGLPMCKAMEEWQKEERQNGRREGRREERIRMIKSLRREGIGEAQIKRITKCSREEYAAAVM